MANLITAGRILFSIALLFLPALSPAFYAFYLVAGLTDMLDGWVARKRGTVSDFGARLDSLADMVFVAVCLVKLLPVLDMPAWLYVWIGIIALIRLLNILSGLIRQKRISMLHTRMNKLTGFLLFVFPLTLRLVEPSYAALPVCALATFAALEEGYLIGAGKIR